MSALENALETALTLPPSEQDELFETLRKRRIETLREEILASANEAMALDDAGFLKSLNVEEIIAVLYEGLDETGAK